MTEIEEIPINSADAVETELTPPGENQDIKDIPKKGRGRPAGAKNKPKPKPAPAAVKPKAKPKAKKPVEYDESESEEEEAPPPRRRARQEQPVEYDRHALAADVLGILQQQRYQRNTARRSHYASWFENIQ